jgi:lysophospholipase L1-like esterase
LVSCTKTEIHPVSKVVTAYGNDNVIRNSLVLKAGVFKDSLTQQFTLRWSTNDQTLKSNPRVVGLGSSTLAGYKLSYPFRLGDKISSWLAVNTSNPYWVNKAVAGYTSTKLLPVSSGGVAGSNIEAALSYNPDFIFVSLPSNDAVNGISVIKTLSNYRLIDSISSSKGVIVFFETTQPRTSSTALQQKLLVELGDSVRRLWPKRYVEGFNDVVDKLAATPATILLKYDTGDGIHLKTEGNQFIADKLFARWLGYFKPITNVSYYRIETSVNKINWTLFDKIYESNTTRKNYAVFKDNDVHYFRVKAIFDTGASSKYSNIAF